VKILDVKGWTEVDPMSSSEDVNPQVPDEEIEEITQDHPHKPSSLIPMLQASQEKFGYLPRNVMSKIADALDLSESKVYGVATFYAQFRFEPLGDHLIKVCHGTACHVKGADHIGETIENELGIKTGETTDDGLFTLERVACLGCCSLAPVIMIDDTAHGNLDRDKVKKVLNKYRGE